MEQLEKIKWLSLETITKARKKAEWFSIKKLTSSLPKFPKKQRKVKKKNENKKQVMALTWGGSGWHIFPLLSLYNYIEETEKYEFLWVWEEGWLEEKIAETNNITFLDIAAGKIRRYFDFRNFYEPLKNLTGVFQWVYYILKYKIDIVFSKWGYVSMPLCIAAKMLWKKIYIHESDVKKGLANKLIGKIATKTFYTFDSDIIDWKKHIHVGQILNRELIEWLTNLNVAENHRLSVMVMAWSQGSTIIFENLLKILPDLWDIDFNVVLGTKNAHFGTEFKKFTNVKTYDFITQRRLWEVLKTTDIAITRWSATALWEFYSFGIHAIIIPITGAGWHQIHNAEYFNERYGSDILDETNNLNLEMFRFLQKYKHLRKSGLNLTWFFDSLEKIEKELED